MFREVTRKKQSLTKEECLRILKETKRGVLSLIGDGGFPYGVPLDHYYNERDGKIYFHSGKSGHKIDAVKNCPKVSYCVLEDGTPDARQPWALRFRSVIVFGTVEFVTDRETVFGIASELSRKFTDDEDYIRTELQRSGPVTAMFALTPAHITGKITEES